MLKISLKNVFAHKRRLISTFLSILSGIAFLAGTLVLGDTITATFNELFADVTAGTDAVVRGKTEIESTFNVTRNRIDESLVDVVREIDGVAGASPDVEGFGQIVSADGEPIGGQGPPTFAGAWDAVDETNPFNIVDGRPPEGPGEVVIDKRSADDGDLAVGDTTTIITTSGAVEVTVVGIAKFGDADSPGGATFALFDLEEAQRLLAKPGQLSSIAVVAEDGVSQEELVQRISAAVPDDTEVITGAELTEENQTDIQEGVGFFTTFLSVFAVISLIVAMFSIYNTFSILVAQRTREMALLRAVGASRRQVLTSVLVEAFAVGLLASIGGLLAGVLVAAGLKGVLDAFGFSIPAGGLELLPGTLITCLVIGVVFTVLAAVFPAIKATRVPPIAAMRDVAIDRTHASRVRVVVGMVLGALGIYTTLSGVLSSEDLGQVGIGILLTLIGMVVLGPVVARPASRALGAPLPPTRGIVGELAVENASRNPRRTSGTAAALMIGVAVVTLFTVFAASFKASINEQLDRSFAGDLTVVTEGFGGGGFSPQLTEQLNELPEVEAATGVRFAAAKVEGDAKDVLVADPATMGNVIDMGVSAGDISKLGDDGIAISDSIAEDKSWGLGTPLRIGFPDGSEETVTVEAIYKYKDVFNGINYLLPTPLYSAHATENLDFFIAVKLRNGVPIAEGRQAIEPLVAPYGNPDVQDREEFKETNAQMIDQLLGLVFTMLALAIIISITGIANTLSLSINERTRELGLLRAVGMTRRQLRATVRWESVIIAVFGTVGGLILGTFFSWALVTAAEEIGLTRYDFPPSNVAMLLIAGALAGIVAALRPARRAAKLDVLQAIATE